METQDFNRKLIGVAWAVLGWLLFSSLYALYYVVSNLAGPPTDAYAATWDFQLLMFAIVRLPYLIMILLSLIAFVLVLPPRKTKEN